MKTTDKQPKHQRKTLTPKTQFKEALQGLIEWTNPRLIEWFEQLETPEKKLDFTLKFLEYSYPKISRVEHTGKDGEAIETLEIDGFKRRELLQRLLKETSREKQ